MSKQKNKTKKKPENLYVLVEPIGNIIWGCRKETNQSRIDQPDQENHIQKLVDLVSNNLHKNVYSGAVKAAVKWDNPIPMTTNYNKHTKKKHAVRTLSFFV